MIEPISFILCVIGATVLVTSVTASKFISERNKYDRINMFKQQSYN